MQVTDTSLGLQSVWGKLCKISFSTAEYLSDYGQNSAVITFQPCDYGQCVDVPLVDDCVVENTEDFRLFLFTPLTTDERISVVRGDGKVLITDNGSMN